MCFFAAIPAVYGWHILPFYPFLCMGLAGLIVRASRPDAPLAYLAVLALLLPYAFHVVFVNHVDWARPMRFAYLLTVAGLAFPLFLRSSFPRASGSLFAHRFGCRRPAARSFRRVGGVGGPESASRAALR